MISKLLFLGEHFFHFSFILNKEHKNSICQIIFASPIFLCYQKKIITPSKPKMKVVMRTPDGRGIDVVIDGTFRTQNLKEMLERVEGIPQSEQCFVFDGHHLQDEASLAEQGVVEGSTIVLLISPPTTSDRSVSVDWLQTFVFPDKPRDKVVAWHALLIAEEFTNIQDFSSVTNWDTLTFIPIAVRCKLRDAVASALAPPPAPIVHSAPLTQLDCVVVDISGSMKSKSAIDPLKTREDVSKLVFSTMVDRILGLEMNHGVALMAFGERAHVFNVTRHFERFEDDLGRLDANEGKTRLYDTVMDAAKLLKDFARTNATVMATDAVLRVFVLTDGEDNASTSSAWQVAQWCQEHGVIVDAFPCAGPNDALHGISTATGGVCVRVTCEQQALELFENEGMLHIASREKAPVVPPVQTRLQFEALFDKTAVVEGVRTVATQNLSSAPMSAHQVATLASAPTSTKAMQRILRDFAAFEKSPPAKCRMFLSANDMFNSRVIVAGPDASRYRGKYFLLSVQFPGNFPMSPPRIKFETKIYHCNINNNGSCCLDAVHAGWSPTMTIASVVEAVLELLREPNADDPLDAWKGDLYRTDRARYDSECAEWLEMYATSTAEELVAKYNLTE